MALIRKSISRGLLHVCSMFSLAQTVSQMLALCCIFCTYVDLCSSLVFMLNIRVTCFVFTASKIFFFLNWLLYKTVMSRQKSRGSEREGETGPGNGTGWTQTYVPMSMCTTHCATAPTSTEEIEGDMKNTI